MMKSTGLCIYLVEMCVICPVQLPMNRSGALNVCTQLIQIQDYYVIINNQIDANCIVRCHVPVHVYDIH